MDNENNRDRNPRVSIIIPVYNVEKYIKKCLDSVISQTLKDIEIILIDDGSTDSSGEICDEYAGKDDRIIVIHDTNHGVFHARNKGLDIARGEYIGFVDSDDYAESDMFEYLYNLAIENKADAVQCGVTECYKSHMIAQKNQDYFKITDGKDYLRHILDGRYSSLSIFCKILKNKVIEKVRFKDYRIGEDAVFLTETAFRVKKAVITCMPKYYYVKRPQSLTTSKFSNDILDFVSACDTIYNMVCDNYPELKRYASMRKSYSRLLALDKMYLSDGFYDSLEEKKIIKYLRKNPGSILYHTSLTAGRRAAFWGLLINKNIYRVIIRFYHSKNRQLTS